MVPLSLELRTFSVELICTRAPRTGERIAAWPKERDRHVEIVAINRISASRQARDENPGYEVASVNLKGTA